MTSTPFYLPLVEAARDPALTDDERQSAFNALVDAFSDQAARWAAARIGRYVDAATARDAADDVAQDALIAAYEHLDQLRDAAAFPAWLRQVVTSQAYRWLREKYFTRRAPLHDDLPAHEDDHGGDPAGTVEQIELAAEVRRALTHLTEGERAVTELYYLRGYSTQEIAERLALPLTTVKKRLQYGRDHLRERLKHTRIVNMTSLFARAA